MRLCKKMAAACVVAAVCCITSGQAAGQVRISQVWGGGNSSASGPNVDFVELLNAGSTAQDLAGWSLQLAGASGTEWTVVPLAGVIPPGKFFLVQLEQPAAASPIGTVLPTPDFPADVTGLPRAGTATAMPISVFAGKVALADSTTSLSGVCPIPNAIVVDFLGYGSGTCGEGGTIGPQGTSTPAAGSVARISDGCQDSGNNGADFMLLQPPNPRGLSHSGVPGGVFTHGSALPVQANAGSSTTFTVNFMGCGNVLPTLVSCTADLTAFGLTSAEAFSGGPATWTYSLNVPATQATAVYPINYVGSDGTNSYPGSFNLQVLGPPPVNDQCEGAIVLGVGPTAFPYASSVTVLTATEDILSVSCNSGNTAGIKYSVWYTYTPTGDGALTLSETATGVDAIWAVWSGACPGFSTAPPAAPVGLCGTADTGQFVLVASGTPVYICVGRQGSSTVQPTGDLVLSFNFIPAPVNEKCDGALPLTLTIPVVGDLTPAQNDYQVTSGNPPFIGGGHVNNTLPGRDVVYTFTPAVTGEYNFRLQASGANFAMFITDVCPSGTSPISIPNGPGGVLFAVNRTSTTGIIAEEIAKVTLNSGTQYWVFVDQAVSVAAGTFSLEVHSYSGEAEPNGTPATATPYVFGDSGMTGSASPASDVDFYSLGSPAAGSRVFALLDGLAGSAATGFSMDVDLRVTTGTQTIERDDNGADVAFGGNSSMVAGTPAPGGPLYLSAKQLTTNITDPYKLYAVVQPPSSAAAAETEPNNTFESASTDPGNYFAGTMSATSDVDFYSFSAAAGDLIFIGLDANPNRNVSTGQNLLLDLRSADGATVLLAVNDTETGCTTPFNPGGTLTSTTPISIGEALVYRARYTGTYFARVTAATVVGGGDYLLSITRHGSTTPTEFCCRGTTCIEAASGSCTGTVAGSNSVVVTACTGNTNAGCCFGDYDHNGTKDITDIFTFLNAWFSASIYADITDNGAGQPDITDIFTFLNAWFGTCD